MLSNQAAGLQIRECLVALAVPALPEPPMVASLATEEEKVRPQSACPAATGGHCLLPLRAALQQPALAVSTQALCVASFGP